MVPPDPRETREERMAIEEFHAQYCWTLDCGDVESWPEYFTDDAVYRITARENADAGLPVGLVYADSKAMIRDRAFALKHTQMYAPRTLQHFVTNVRVLELKAGPGGSIKAQSNYLLLQTLVDGPTTIQQSGRYYDTFVRANGRLLLKERQCIYDTVLIANDLVLPV
jgi:3-phenylpropionate/cinnamic acid dioxygenase small subunit